MRKLEMEKRGGLGVGGRMEWFREVVVVFGG